MNKKYLKIVVACASFAMASHQTTAALLWFADFSSYDTSGGAAELILNASGDNDTFSSTTFNNMKDTVIEVRGSGVPSFMSGNALYLASTGTGATGTSSARLFLSSLEPMGASGVRIISFDLIRDSSNGFSLANEVRTTTGRSGNTVYHQVPEIIPLRVTIVVNRSGSEITLPGGLGTLANNSLASYLYDGTNFSTVASSTGNVTSNAIAGFGTGMSLSNLGDGVLLASWYDNFGIWDDINDTVNGISVLQLNPGTVVVPESSKAAVILPAFAILIVLLGRRFFFPR